MYCVIFTFNSLLVVAWLQDITLSDININGSGTIEYTTVSSTLSCNNPQNLQIQLLRSDGVTSVKSYVPQTTDKFHLQFVDPSRPLMYTLQVIDANSFTVGSLHTGYIVSPSSLSTQTSSTAATTSTNTPSSSTTGQYTYQDIYSTFVHKFIHPSIHLSIYPLIHKSMLHPSIHPSIH